VFVEKVNESNPQSRAGCQYGKESSRRLYRCGVDFCESEFRGTRANTTLLKILLGQYCWKRKRGKVDIKRKIERGGQERREGGLDE